MDNVRRSQWGEQFSVFLPLYLDPDHFKRSLPLLKKAASTLANSTAGSEQLLRSANAYVPPNKRAGSTGTMPVGKTKWRGLDLSDRGEASKGFTSSSSTSAGNNGWLPRTESEQILEMLCKIMNTMVVLLSDRGIEISENILEGFTWLAV